MAPVVSVDITVAVSCWRHCCCSTHAWGGIAGVGGGGRGTRLERVQLRCQLSDPLILVTSATTSLGLWGRGRCRGGRRQCGRCSVASERLATGVCVDCGDVDSECCGKGEDRAVGGVWVGRDVVGDVQGESRERGDEGFGVEKVSLVGRHGVC
jgi:hypothetical protein